MIIWFNKDIKYISKAAYLISDIATEVKKKKSYNLIYYFKGFYFYFWQMEGVSRSKEPKLNFFFFSSSSCI